MDPLIAFFTGIVAAFSPCVAVLIPIVLYRFSAEKKMIRFLYYSAGFLLLYMIFGIISARILSSSFHNGIRIGLGILFIYLGILSYMNRINPLNLPVVENPFVLGGLFALVVSANPCTLPYLSLIVSLGFSQILANLFMFGLGLLMPSLLFAFFGNRIISISRFTAKLHKPMSILLIASGFYFALSITSMTLFDVYFAAFILFLGYVLLIRSFYLFRKKDFWKPYNLTYVASLFLVVAAVVIHCSSRVGPAEPACSFGGIFACPICMNCLILFMAAATLGLASVFMMRRYNRE